MNKLEEKKPCGCVNQGSAGGELPALKGRVKKDT